MLQREGQRVEGIKFGSKLHIMRCNSLFYTNIRHNRREINIELFTQPHSNDSVFTFQPGWNSDEGTCLNNTGCACSATVRAVPGLTGSDLPTPDAYSQAGQPSPRSPAAGRAGRQQPQRQPHQSWQPSPVKKGFPCMQLFPTSLKTTNKQEKKENITCEKCLCLPLSTWWSA